MRRCVTSPASAPPPSSTAAFADIETRLKDYTADTSPWRHIARELLASVQFRPRAMMPVQQAQAILADMDTPAPVRQRAAMMASCWSRW